MENGKGFEQQTVNLGNGLNNLKKRAKELNGGITIVSNNSSGTKIILFFKK
jgi:signal transduction histidine kinase